MTTKRRKRPSEPMRVEDGLAAKRGSIERELARVLSRDDSPLFRVMRYAVFPGGKRFRPLLVLSTGDCLGADPRPLLAFAGAVELIHNYSLVHDDLPSMDNDDIRRGKPTCHRAFGEDLAILAGDGLLTLAYELMTGAGVRPADLGRKQEAIRAISRSAGVDGLIGGQVLDITLGPESITRAQMDALMRRKTGALIGASVEAGAILGRARAAEKRALMEYAKNVGLAFQVRDDILDWRGKRREDTPDRPNYAALAGEEAAGRRLKRLVRRALVALEGLSRRTGELRWLAQTLLEPEGEARGG